MVQVPERVAAWRPGHVLLAIQGIAHWRRIRARAAVPRLMLPQDLAPCLEVDRRQRALLATVARLECRSRDRRRVELYRGQRLGLPSIRMPLVFCRVHKKADGSIQSGRRLVKFGSCKMFHRGERLTETALGKTDAGLSTRRWST